MIILQFNIVLQDNYRHNAAPLLKNLEKVKILKIFRVFSDFDLTK